MKHRLAFKVGVLASMMLLASTSGLAADPDSFGRGVKYLDTGYSPSIIYYTGTITCPTTATCRKIANAQSTQTFSEPDRIVISLPAASTNSLLCFSYSPFVGYNLAAGTTALDQYINYQHFVSIDSSVLANPLLINKVTGQPFNGTLTINNFIQGYSVNKTIQANSHDSLSYQYTRECVGGLLSTSILQSTYGLTLSQAQSVMRSAMTLRFGTTTTVSITGVATSTVGLRIFGD